MSIPFLVPDKRLRQYAAQAKASEDQQEATVAAVGAGESAQSTSDAADKIARSVLSEWPSLGSTSQPRDVAKEKHTLPIATLEN